MSAGEFTTDRILLLLDLRSEPLSALEETPSEWWLGTFSLDKKHPSFRVGYGGALTEQSRFRKQWFDSGKESQRGWAAIFRQYDQTAASSVPEEFFVGWVPKERESELDQWITFLNQEIKKRMSTHQVETTARRRLTYVGAFSELGFDDVLDAPSLLQSRGRLLSNHKKQIVDYLTAGPTIVVSPGFEDDVFEPGKRAGSSSYGTDGTYAWPKVLAYYVDRYDVALPPEFLAHGDSNQWTLPDGIDTRALSLPGDAL